MILTATCHCGANHYSFQVADNSLPLKASLCSCNISRHISGVLLTSYVPIPADNAAPNLEKITRYKSSSILNRYFCSICSSHMFLEYFNDGHFEVSTGSIDVEHSDHIIKYQAHMWIADTRDGGASDWITKIGSNHAVRWQEEAERSAEVPLDWQADASTPEKQTKSTAEKLHAHCHCGDVEFYITRPSELSLQASSPFPDLLVPYTSGQSAENPENQPWWLSNDRKRYLAGHCACKSCRLIAGFDLVQWAFVPTANIELITGEPLSQGVKLGATGTYESSPGVTRYFCKSCGCNVFWSSKHRPTLFDIAVGLLDAESGSKALEWLEWDIGRVSFTEEAHHRGLVDGLEAGLVSWSSRRNKTGQNG